jgi:hypothetical protein
MLVVFVPLRRLGFRLRVLVLRLGYRQSDLRHLNGLIDFLRHLRLGVGCYLMEIQILLNQNKVGVQFVDVLVFVLASFYLVKGEFHTSKTYSNAPDV